MKFAIQLVLALSLFAAAAPKAQAMNIYDVAEPVYVVLGPVLSVAGAIMCGTVMDCGLSYERMKRAQKDIEIKKRNGFESEFLAKFIVSYRQLIKTNYTTHQRPSPEQIDALTDAQVSDIAEYSYLVHAYLARNSLSKWMAPRPDARLVEILYPKGVVSESAEGVVERIRGTAVHGVSLTLVEDRYF